jgi:hypothetical protein
VNFARRPVIRARHLDAPHLPGGAGRSGVPPIPLVEQKKTSPLPRHVLSLRRRRGSCRFNRLSSTPA